MTDTQTGRTAADVISAEDAAVLRNNTDLLFGPKDPTKMLFLLDRDLLDQWKREQPKRDDGDRTSKQVSRRYEGAEAASSDSSPR